MRWLMAGVKALVIVLYFVVFSIWLPSRLLRVDAVASAESAFQDLVATGAWLIAVTVGVVGLRAAQRRGLI